ncbi:MAG: PAS domain S-box protein [Bacteroidota bacterium]
MKHICSPLCVAGLYAAFSSAWILLSDTLLESVVLSQSEFTGFSVIKGLTFVLVTATALWFLLRRNDENKENERRESEERFRKLAENAQDLIYRYRLASPRGFEYVSPSALAITGYTPEEHYADPDLGSKLVHPEDRSVLDRLFHDGTFESPVTLRWIRKDQKVIWTEQRNVPIYDEQKNLIAVEGIARDITSRKANESALRLQSAALESTASGVVITDREGTIVWVNKAFSGMTGYPREETVGRNPRILKSGSQNEAFYKELWQTILAGKIWRGQMVNKRKDGTTYVEEQTITPVLDEQGQITHFVSVKQDSTDRMSAEHQLREQAALLDIVPDAIIIRDLDNRIQFWNKGAETIYGWKPEEVHGRIASGLLYTGQDNFPNILNDIMVKGGWEGELDHMTKQGTPLIIQTRWRLIRDADGEPLSVLSVGSDITEKKSFEAQFLRSQRLESLGTLAGGIAHDLNNVLAPILLSFESIKRKMTDEKAIHLLSVAESSAMRGKQIISQVLTFARGLESAKGPLQLRHLMMEIGQIIKETFPRSIEIKIAVPHDLPMILGDSTQIHQMMMNLSVNARDAMSKGGTLRISASNVELDEAFALMKIGSRAGPYVVLEVTDTGDGIPGDHLERIFDPFFTTKEVGKGTGLGLSTVHTIVKGHGGFIDVKSKPGFGTTFKIHLPAITQKEGAPVSLQDRQFPRGNHELILVVDDEESIREITSQMLESFDYRCLTATDGIDGVTKLASHKEEVALVVMDLMMPVMDGPNAIRAMRRIKADIKIIASSGISPDHKDFITDSGVAGFLEKPYTAEQMLTMIQRVLNVEDGGGRGGV